MAHLARDHAFTFRPTAPRKKLSVDDVMKDSSERRYRIGFDLGGTKMLCILFDEKFKPVARKRKRTKGHDGAQLGVSRILDTIKQTLEAGEIQPKQLAGIGFGCPSPIDMEDGVILEAVNLGWDNVPMRAQLEEHFGCPAAVLNDVDAGVYAEHRFGAGVDAHCVLGIFPGTGIGGGCVYDGRIVSGRHRSCMEVGHIQVEPDGERCGCGRYGCLETVASRLSISAAAAQAAYRGEAPHLMKEVGTDISEIRSGALAASVENGDEVVEEILKRAANRLGVAIANMVHILAPDVVVLGGGLVEAMPDLMVKGARNSARDRVMSPFRDSFEVVASKLGDDASVLGAAAWIEKASQ